MSKVIDLTGQKFGHLTVIERAQENTKDGKARWICECDCGNKCVIRADCLRLGRTKSCGHDRQIIDLTGKRFGHLTVIEEAGKGKNGKAQWKCVCDCGNECIVLDSSLKTGNTKTCGCRNYRKPVDLSKRDRIDKRIVRIWAGMYSRCLNEKATGYKNYGGRGIKICDEWIGKDGCRHFYEWAKQNGYKDGLTIDRIDVNGNYEPSNCRWITMEEQMSNMQKSIRVLYKGEKVSPVELSELTGININTVYSRLRKLRDSNGRIGIVDCSDW